MAKKSIQKRDLFLPFEQTLSPCSCQRQDINIAGGYPNGKIVPISDLFNFWVHTTFFVISNFAMIEEITSAQHYLVHVNCFSNEESSFPLFWKAFFALYALLTYILCSTWKLLRVWLQGFHLASLRPLPIFVSNNARNGSLLAGSSSQFLHGTNNPFCVLASKKWPPDTNLC